MADALRRRRPLHQQLQMVLGKAEEVVDKLADMQHPSQPPNEAQGLAIDVVSMLMAVLHPLQQMHVETTEYSWEIRKLDRPEPGLGQLHRWEVYFHRVRDDGSEPIHGGGTGATPADAMVRAAMAFHEMEVKHP